MSNRRTYCLLVVFAVASLVIFWQSSFRGFAQSGDRADSLDYLQLAENISQGKGYRTGILRPVFSALRDPFAERWRAPLVPYATAAVLKSLSPSDFARCLVPMIAFISLIPLTFAFAIKLTRDRTTALFAAGIVGVSYDMLCSSTTLMTETPFAALMVGALIFAIDGRRGIFRTLALAIILHLICLVRPNGFVAATSVVAFLGVRTGIIYKRIDPLIFSFMILSPISWWYLSGGLGFGTLAYAHYTHDYPGWSIFSHADMPHIAGFVFNLLDEIVLKWFKNARLLFLDVLQSFPLFILFFASDYFLPRRSRYTLYLGIICLFAPILFVLAGPPYNHRFLIPTIPVMAVFASFTIVQVVALVTDGTGARRFVIGSIFVSFFVSQAALFTLSRHGHSEIDRVVSYLTAHPLSARAPGVVTTNAPELVRFVTGATTMLLPFDRREFAAAASRVTVSCIIIFDGFNRDFQDESDWLKSRTVGIGGFREIASGDRRIRLYLRDTPVTRPNL